MIRRWGTLALCAAALIPTAGCERPPSATGFVVAYGEPDAADRDDARLLRERRTVEAAAAALNGYVDLPYRVTVLALSCGGEGSGYDPASRRIELCYEDLTEERELFEAAGRSPADEEAAAVMTETVYHEAGHALAAALGLRFDGDRAEEDAADRFAALMLIREGPDGERTLRTAAEGYELAAAEPADPGRDEHAPPAARAQSHRCLLHGAAPQRHPAPAARTGDCAATWTRTRDVWLKDLTPLLKA